MVFLLSKRCEILYGTSKIQKKISTGTQNLCQSHTIQYIKLKKNGNFKMGNLTLTEILSAWRDLFWIFVVPYKISHLFNNKNTIWLKIYPCFRSQITTCNLPTWPGKPCIIIVVIILLQQFSMANMRQKPRDPLIKQWIVWKF